MYIYEEWKELSEFISTIDPIQLILDASLDDEYMKVKPLNAYPNINKSYGGNGNVNLLKTHGGFKSTNMRHANNNANLRDMKRQGLITSKY
jgi:hypothetical protein|tara:strand:- start:37 stop:309 length:273 start_codon:yes stop_codon:yes gene_type:complete